MKYRRVKRHISPQVKALADAQRIAFAPLTFQAVNAMLKFGIIKLIYSKITKNKPITSTSP